MTKEIFPPCHANVSGCGIKRRCLQRRESYTALRMNVNRRLLARVFPCLLLGLCSCDLHKKLADLDFNQGVKNYDAGNFGTASNDFSRAIVQNPNHSEAYIYRGIIRHNAGDYTLAIEDYEKAIAINPDEQVTYVDLGISQEALGNCSGAISNYSQALKLNATTSTAVDAYISRGSARTTLRDWDGALADFAEAEKLDPNNPELYSNRAYMQFVRREFKLCDADATKAISAKNDDGDSYRIRGLARMQMKDYEGALADLNAAVKWQPKDAEAVAGRGELKATRDDLTGAKLDAAKAMELEPTNLTAVATLAMVKRKSGDLPGALLDISKWTQHAPKSSDAFHILGTLQYDSSQYPEALKSFRTAIELDDKNYYSRFWIWMIRTRLGERDEATKELSANIKARGQDDEHEWELCVGRFLIGDLSASNLIAQASEKAKHSWDVSGRRCEAYYYAGMKELLEENTAAVDHFKKCLTAGEEEYPEYFSAELELRRAGEQPEIEK